MIGYVGNEREIAAREKAATAQHTGPGGCLLEYGPGEGDWRIVEPCLAVAPLKKQVEGQKRTLHKVKGKWDKSQLRVENLLDQLKDRDEKLGELEEEANFLQRQPESNEVARAAGLRMHRILKGGE